MKTYPPRREVRYDRAEGEFTMRCPSCVSSGQTKAYWPLTLEFWDPASGLQTCRACQRIRRRVNRHQTVEERRAKQRAYYRAHRPERLAWRHAYHMKHRDEINAQRRAKYAAAKPAQPNGLWDQEVGT